MREIVLDTETTGLRPEQGHKLVEIGCVELINYIPTGKTFHTYINPMRDMPNEAFSIHGLGSDFLRQHPIFEEQANKFLQFIDNDRLIIHNARFDMTFLNTELQLIKLKPLSYDRTLDTLKLARTKFPGSPASLDALCKRFKIDNTNRTLHGALLDAELLAKVYLELIGGAQPDLIQANDMLQAVKSNIPSKHTTTIKKTHFPQRKYPLSDAEKKKHEKFVDSINNPLWNN